MTNTPIIILLFIVNPVCSPPGMPATSETATVRATGRICRWRPLRLRRFAPVRWRTLKPCQYTRNLSQFMRSTTSLSQPMKNHHHHLPLHHHRGRRRSHQHCMDLRPAKPLPPRPHPPTYHLPEQPGEGGSKAQLRGDQRRVDLIENQKY